MRLSALVILIGLVPSCTSITTTPSIPSETPFPSEPTVTTPVSPRPTRTLPPTPQYLFLPDAPSTTPLPELNLRDLIALREDLHCPFPCWNGLQPGVSAVDDISAVLAAFDIKPDPLDRGTYTILPNGDRVRGAGNELEYRESPTARSAYELGLELLAVYWNPVDGRALATWLEYYTSPPGFDLPSFFSEMGIPEQVLMDYHGPMHDAVAFTFPSKGTLFYLLASRRDWPRLCFTRDYLDQISVVFADTSNDPLAYAWVVHDIPEYLDQQQSFTGLSQQEFLAAISTGDRCINMPPQ